MEFNNPALDSEKKRKAAAAIAVLCVLVAVTAIVLFLKKANKEKAGTTYVPQSTKTEKPEVKAYQHDHLRNAWLVKSTQDLETLQEKAKEQQEKIKQLEEMLERQEASQALLLESAAGGGPVSPTGKAAAKNSPGVKTKRAEQRPAGPPTNPAPVAVNFPPPPPPATANKGASLRNKLGAQIQGQVSGVRNAGDVPAQPRKEVKSNLMGRLGDELPKADKEDKEEKSQKAKQKQQRMMPPGVFMRGRLLTGVDAPTGGKAKGSPYPVLIEITSLAYLPNDWRVDIRSCTAIGEGYGNLSSERVEVRLSKLSCMLEDGTSQVKPITGYLTDETGKVGLRGRVVARQGSILARTLMAGFVQGAAEAFALTATNIERNPLTGVTQGVPYTPDTSEALRLGLGTGVSNALNKLVDIYINYSEEMHPVIEVGPGRMVSLVFMGETDLNFSSGEEKNT